MKAVERRVVESPMALVPPRVEPTGVAQTGLGQAAVAVIVSLDWLHGTQDTWLTKPWRLIGMGNEA